METEKLVELLLSSHVDNIKLAVAIMQGLSITEQLMVLNSFGKGLELEIEKADAFYLDKKQYFIVGCWAVLISEIPIQKFRLKRLVISRGTLFLYLTYKNQMISASDILIFDYYHNTTDIKGEAAVKLFIDCLLEIK